MKKILIASSMILAPIIVAPIVLTSCSVETNYKEIDSKINQSLKEIITDESAINLNNYFSANSRNNITKEGIAEIIEINQDAYVMKHIIEYNLFDQYKDNAIEAVYEAYVEETSTSDNNSRHGSIFSSHFWQVVWRKLKSRLIFFMRLLWWAIQIVPTVIAFIGSLDETVLAEGIASFDANVLDFFRVLMYDVLMDIKNFKSNTKCTWKFLIWNNNGSLIFI